MSNELFPLSFPVQELRLLLRLGRCLEHESPEVALVLMWTDADVAAVYVQGHVLALILHVLGP